MSISPLHVWLSLAAVGLLGGCSEPTTSVQLALPMPNVVGLQQVTSFGANPGALRMWKYVPSGVPSNAPLVVALHGCGEDATTYQAAGWNELADQHHFYVVYPEETNDLAQGCFDWSGLLSAGDLERGMGESQSIKSMVERMQADHGIDPTRVFATGLSAGGAEVALLLAVWPDVFAAGGIIAGIPYRCATTYSAAQTCISPGKTQTPTQWADKVKTAFPGYGGAYPRVSIWQGDSDDYVDPKNLNELVKQWTAVHGLSQTPSASDTTSVYEHNEYRDANNFTQVESYVITGGGHGVPVDPTHACGEAGGDFYDVGVCSSLQLARFFGLIAAAPPPMQDAAVSAADLAPTPGADLGSAPDASVPRDVGAASCALGGGASGAPLILVALLLIALWRRAAT